MEEKEKYKSIYAGPLGEYYVKNDSRGQVDKGYGRACWGENALQFLSAHSAQSVIDIGCGYGRFCDYATGFIPKVYGMDIASVITGNTIKNDKITFFDGEAKKIPLPDKAVEWVCSFDCLEHCLPQDIDTIFNEFDRVASKGFVLSIAYIHDICNGVELHMTVQPEEWWIEKISKYGKTFKWGKVPLTDTPYIICQK